MSKVEDFFYPKRGRGGYIEEFETGTTPLVSATSENNGVSGFVDTVPYFKAPAITVERVAGFAFVQTVDFSTVPDDITVLVPKRKMDLEKLYLIASIITNARWRFSFGRKLTPTRLKSIEISLDNLSEIKLTDLESILPKKNQPASTIEIERTESFELGSIFKLHSGDFHDASKLPHGRIPLVSCGETNNGIIGFVKVPEDAIFNRCLTVAYNGQPLTTKFHPYSFAAKDDVAVCIPKDSLKLSTLIFIQCILNNEKWRFSYGRKCFREKLKHSKIELPSDGHGLIDEQIIGKIMSSCSYWNALDELADRVASSGVILS